MKIILKYLLVLLMSASYALCPRGCGWDHKRDQNFRQGLQQLLSRLEDSKQKISELQAQITQADNRIRGYYQSTLDRCAKNHSDKESVYLHGLLLFGDGKYLEAYSFLEKSLRHFSFSKKDLESFQIALAESEIELGLYDQAFIMLPELVEKNPKHKRELI